MDDKLIDTLIEMGLTTNEARIYFSILTLGPASVIKISEKSVIKRSTVYPILNSLIDKGLVNIQTQGVKQAFAAENPEKIDMIVNKRRSILKEIQPDLTNLYSEVKNCESHIKHVHGTTSVKSLFLSTLNELTNDDYCYMISGKIKLQELIPNHVESKILLENSDFNREHITQAEKSNAEIKLLKTSKPLATDTIIMAKKMIIAETTSPHVAITIENQNIIEMNLAMFNAVWNSAET